MNALFGMAVSSPIAGQFWFIRDLMALIVLAPAIHFLLVRKLALPSIAVLFCLWFLSSWPILWPRVEASFFFILGAYLSRPGINAAYLDRFGPWISAVFFGLLVVNSAFSDKLLFIHKAMLAAGVPSLWWLTGLAARTVRLKSLLMRLSGASFFVFATHEPLLMILRKVIYKLLMPASGATILALYFFIPVCLVAILIAAHGFLLKIAPSFTGFITGSSFRRSEHRA
jgi:hypothetical protein